jgi:hypothetical protein
MSIEERITALKTSKHHALVEQIDSALEGVQKLTAFLQSVKGADRVEVGGKGTGMLFKDTAPGMFDLILANATTHINVEIDVRLLELEKLVK